MAKVSPISPLMHTKGSAAALDDILITIELSRRQSRVPDYASENRALVALAREMAINPYNLPPMLVDMAVDLCRAGTAGLSVLKADADGEYLVWEALSGAYVPHIRNRAPRHCSPCGITLDRNAPQLFSYPSRHFTYFAQADAPIVESLVIPVCASDRPLGTMWIMAHDEARHFDAEDLRLMTSFSAFASAALQVISSLEEETQANPARHAGAKPRKAVLRKPLAVVRPGRPADSALHTGEWQFRRLLEKLPAAAYTCDPNGLITYFNPQAVELWGRAPRLNDPVDRFCGSFKLFATDGTPIAHDHCWMALALTMDQEYNGHEIVIERPNGRRLTALAYANPIHDEAGKLLGAVNVLVDITERKQAEEIIYLLLRISEKLNSTLDVDALLDILVNEAIHLVNAESGVSGLYTSEGMVCKKYFRKGEPLPLEYCWPPLHGLPGWLIVHKTPYLMNDALTDTQIVHELCVQFGVRSALSTPILSSQGDLLGFFEIHNKVVGEFTPDDQDKLLAVSHAAAVAIENALAYRKLRQTEARLQASLYEKEVLLKEIHHRVKNNLQVIASLLYLQSDQLRDPEDIALFEETQDRVRSMALIHESLYRTGDLAHFNFAHYIERLSTHLVRSYVAEVSRIRLHTELDEVAFDIDTAIPCGLILNELLTNALKYAFPDGRAGDIHIRLRAEGERVTLCVHDTGIGFPEGFDFRNTESLGLQLVGMMTEQLGGVLTFTCEGGTTFTLSIPCSTR